MAGVACSTTRSLPLRLGLPETWPHRLRRSLSADQLAIACSAGGTSSASKRTDPLVSNQTDTRQTGEPLTGSPEGDETDVPNWPIAMGRTTCDSSARVH